MTIQKPAPRCIAAISLVVCMSGAGAQTGTTDSATNPLSGSGDTAGTVILNPVAAPASASRPTTEAYTGERADTPDATTAQRNEDGSTLPAPAGNPGINNDKAVPLLPVTEPEEIAALTFSDLDSDGNGEFTAAERDRQRVFLEATFSSMDTNHNGSVDQFEFEDFQHRKETQLAE